MCGLTFHSDKTPVFQCQNPGVAFYSSGRLPFSLYQLHIYLHLCSPYSYNSEKGGKKKGWGKGCINNIRTLDNHIIFQVNKAQDILTTKATFAVLRTYRARYFPSLLMDNMEAGFLSRLLCPILFHVLISQTATTDLSPV